MIHLLFAAGRLARRAVPVLLIAGAIVVVAMAGALIGDVVGRAFSTPPRVAVADIVSRLQTCQELATTRITLRSIQRAKAVESGVVLSNTDEVLCRLLINGDYGLSLSAISANRIDSRSDRIRLTLPVPTLLAPGFTASVPEVLDLRSTRWVTDNGPGMLAALQQARTSALAEAPLRAHELDVDTEIRSTTRRAIRQLLPHLLGRPELRIDIRFDDEPGWPAGEPVAPPAPEGRG